MLGFLRRRHTALPSSSGQLMPISPCASLLFSLPQSREFPPFVRNIAVFGVVCVDRYIGNNSSLPTGFLASFSSSLFFLICLTVAGCSISDSFLSKRCNPASTIGGRRQATRPHWDVDGFWLHFDFCCTDTRTVSLARAM